MKEKKKPNGYWTKDKCQELALLCESKPEFKKRFSPAYNAAYRGGFICEICIHMKNQQKSNGYWTKEKIQEVVLLCTSRSEFQKKYITAYSIAQRKGFLDEICSKMQYKKKRNGYWTKEKIQEAANLCTNKIEFSIKYCGAYQAAIRGGFLDEICSKMKSKGDKFKRMIYVFEFSDNYVYIGLTGNKERRFSDHLTGGGRKHKNSAVYNHIVKTNLNPIVKELSTYISSFEAQKLEKETIENYKNNNWNVLNSAKAGSLGGSTIKWTFDNCNEEVKKCPTLSDFIKYSGSAYNSILKNGWNELLENLQRGCTPKGYWNDYEKCKKEAKKYLNRKSFGKGCVSAYKFSRINGWLDDFYPKPIK